MSRRIRRPIVLLSASLVVALASASRASEPVATPADDAVPEAEALRDDILDAIALPLVADEARDAGVDGKELETAIDAVDAGGGTAADAGAVIEAEGAQARKRGGKAGFGAWVRRQVADGKRGKELAELIAAKKATYAELDAAEKAELDAKLAALRERALAHRERVHERREALLAAGKQLERAHAERLGELERRLANNETRKARIAAALAADPSKKEQLAKILEALDRRGERLDARKQRVDDRGERIEDAQERIEDAQERAEDRKERREDRKERREDRKDRREGKHG